jgi:tetratricopeptide (TPR) repeat protein
VAFGNRGVAYANLGDHQKAINDYDQAIALKPNTRLSWHKQSHDYKKPQHLLG